MTETLKTHASLRGTNAVSDEANQLSWFHIRTEECQDCTFSLLPKLTEFRRGQSASVTTLNILLFCLQKFNKSPILI